MSFQSLIVHNGVSHQQSSPVEKPKPSPPEAKTDSQHNLTDSPTIEPEINSTSKQQVLETPETKIEIEEETPVRSNLATATLFPGFGEFIFTLLIASPFLLFGLKKWLHK